MINELEQLGLAANDAKVYQAIIELGTVGGGEISRKTGFHRNIVYESLDRLVARHLITKVYLNKITLFQLSDPKKLLYEINQKAELAERVAAEIEARSNVKSGIVVYDGEEGFRTFYKNNVARTKPGNTFYVLGSLGDSWMTLMEPIFPWFVKQMRKKRIGIRSVAYEVNEKDNILIKSGIKIELRLMPKGYIQTPANTNFCGDYVWLQTGIPPYSVIDIYNPALAQSYKENFDLLWESAAKDYPKV
jgi:predicted transcriptional regulator